MRAGVGAFIYACFYYLVWAFAAVSYFGCAGTEVATLLLTLGQCFFSVLEHLIIYYCTGTCGGGWSAGAEFRAVFYFIF